MWLANTAGFPPSLREGLHKFRCHLTSHGKAVYQTASEAVLFARIADPDHLQRGYRPGAHFLLLVAQCYVPELSCMQLKRFREGYGKMHLHYLADNIGGSGK